MNSFLNCFLKSNYFLFKYKVKPVRLIIDIANKTTYINISSPVFGDKKVTVSPAILFDSTATLVGVVSFSLTIV